MVFQIAFTLVSIVDGGETAVFRSGRISKKYESQGIAKWQLTKLTEHLRKMREVRFIDTTTTREDTRAIQRHLEGKCYTVAHRVSDPFLVDNNWLSKSITFKYKHILHSFNGMKFP